MKLVSEKGYLVRGLYHFTAGFASWRGRISSKLILQQCSCHVKIFVDALLSGGQVMGFYFGSKSSETSSAGGCSVFVGAFACIIQPSEGRLVN